jgi:predicted O-linked N-acetylglucosamine transferase (SPINDLY family)
VTATDAQQLFAQAVSCHQSGQLPQARTLYRQVLNLQPGHFDALHLSGVICAQSAQFEQAVALFEQAIAINSKSAHAYLNLGTAQLDLKRYAAAAESFACAIALKPGYIAAYMKQGNALQLMMQYQAALASFEQAIALNPNYAEAFNNRGLSLSELQLHEAAVASYEQAIAIKPDYAEAYYNLGLELVNLKRHMPALIHFERAIALRADFVDGHISLANALVSLNQFNEAVLSFERAIALKPDHAEAYFNLGLALNKLKQYPAALKSFEQAFKLKPDIDFLFGEYLYAKLRICEWSGIEAEFAELSAKIQTCNKISSPFSVLSFTGSPALQRIAAEVWVADKFLDISASDPYIVKHPARGKIRVAYFSADFRDHAVAFLTAELFEKHDRSRFEIIAFAFGADFKDEMRARLEAGFDQFIDIRNLSDQEAVQLARNMQIDIAVDLGGHTVGCRTEIFAMRAAPVQVSYIGYLGTMGAAFMDYLIADRVIIPEQAKPHYAEKIVYLPSYQVNDSRRRIADVTFTRSQLGLPETGFVFCCFNNNYKITPSVFSLWMRILQSVPGSVLFLYAENAWSEQNLINAAVLRGVNPERLVFGKKLALPEYLARYRQADLFLDTQPYNAGTTASDALWAGLPVLTCPGESFAGRVAASLLTAIGLPELIAQTPAQYEALAIELATHPDKLTGIRTRLAQNRLTTPLFDTELFTANLEAAFTQMYERYQAGLPPEDLY